MAANNNNKLGRSYFIKRKIEISRLFETGRRLNSDFIKIIWTCEDLALKPEVKIFISVPKRLINDANQRNLLKRRIREALRINLGEIKAYTALNSCSIKIGVVYSSAESKDYNSIENKIILSLQNIYSNIRVK
jgi:ribonuclease P protein component